MSQRLSIIEPLQPSRSTCGYCGTDGNRSVGRTSFTEAAALPLQLSCDAYQKMIDRGWRRSGTYCYKPDLQRSCCPQYTIKLDVFEFKPSKSQRKLLNRWNRHVLEGDKSKDSGSQAQGSRKKETKAKSKAKGQAPPDLTALVHASEKQFTDEPDACHSFEVTLEPSSYTEEKFALFQSYEANIHKKLDRDPDSFTSFLVDSPLLREPIPYPNPPPAHLPTEYGAYHQLYRLDGKLIAMGVIDILPSCVSSVYFMWEKEYEAFSLGKLSALREASLAREIHEAGAQQMSSLYMGFYIHSCQKMRYKGEYSPSYLADPEDYSWHPLSECRPLLDTHRYACFTHPERSIQGPAPAQPQGSPPSPPQEELQEIRMLDLSHGRPTTQPVNESPYWRFSKIRSAILSVITAFGVPLARECVFYLES